MSDEQLEVILGQVRDSYNVPNETPRGAMWEVISGRIGNADAVDPSVVDISDVRQAREREARAANKRSRGTGWAVSAAAVLVLGIGIGRMTAPPSVQTEAVAPMGDVTPASFTLAAREHFGRTESLLTMVRADARAGRVDPATTAGAAGLLSQTRLLLDAQGDSDLGVTDLLLDVELLLIQIVGVSETGSMDEARARTELELALRSLDEGEVLPRIQAVLPAGMEGA